MSTDPAKAAAVESHARELQGRQGQESTSVPAATHKSTTKTKSSTHAKSGSHAKTGTHAKSGTHTTHKASASKAAKPAKT